MILLPTALTKLIGLTGAAPALRQLFSIGPEQLQGEDWAQVVLEVLVLARP